MAEFIVRSDAASAKRQAVRLLSSVALKTLLALIEKPDHVCYRYRVAAFAPWLREAGWTIEAEPIARGIVPFFRQQSRIASADAVLLQRRLLPWWQTRLLRRNAKALLFDMDDAVFYRDSNSRRGHESGRRRRRFATIVKHADAVLAGNAFLAEQARRYTAAAKVHEVPTTVDPSRYRPNPSSRRGGEVRLVWIGSGSTLTSLNDVRPALVEATRRLPGLTLRVICDVFPQWDGVTIEQVVWSAKTEVAELENADIGISILPEHPWSLGKCGLKVLQYMAAGLPVIANPYGVHRDMIIPDGDGALADSTGPWADAIVRLAVDPDLRSRMGAAARAKLEGDYSVGVWGPRLARILADASSTPT